MKEQSKTPEKEVKNEEITNQPDGEFKALVIKMPTDFAWSKNERTNEGYQK